jgi:hypothetical protein
MSRRAPAATIRRNRLRVTLIWCAGGALLVIALLRWEQTALLYGLATVGVTALLVVVATADLSGARRSPSQPVLAEDAGAGTTNNNSQSPSASWGAAKRK